MPGDKDPIFDSKQILLREFLQQASIEALIELCQAIAARAGIRDIDGLPVYEFFQKIKIGKLDEILIGLETHNPGVAAQLQSEVDAAKRRLGYNSE